MRSGRLRHRVTLQTPSADHWSAASWSDTATLWAGIEPISGGEKMRADAVESHLTHRVRMRYRAVTTDQRIKWGSRYLDINSVVDIGERHEELELMCTEASS